MVRLTVAIAKGDDETLMELARREKRRPREQAAFLLSRALQDERLKMTAQAVTAHGQECPAQ